VAGRPSRGGARAWHALAIAPPPRRRWRESAACLGAREGIASFRFLDGTTLGATLEILDGTTVIYVRGRDDTALDMNAFLDGTPRVYDPQSVRLTTVRREYDERGASRRRRSRTARRRA
jgi:hypothetical protein